MKTVGKMVLTLVALLSVAATASAADKLVVNNGSGTPVFKVDDAGSINIPGMFIVDNVNKKAGLATSTPLSSFHMVDTSTSSARGLIVAQHNGDGVTWTTGYHAANIVLRKSRGTEASPIAVQYDATNGGDFIATLHAQAWDGTAYQNGASFAYRIDGPVTSGNTPTALSIYTGTNNTTKKINLHVASNGNIGMGTTTPTSKLQVVGLPVYADNATALAGGLTAGAFYRTSTGVLMVVY